ncbi:MAG: carbon-nitrogen hydrolase family protein [Proteobacteria bacterium]|nr:carbon-nitrogen hydrolase family protein [Pseudomonadota bacterium]
MIDALGNRLLRISLVQMVSSRAVDPNLTRAEALIAEAARSEPGAIFLPENFAALAADNPRTIGEAEADGTGPVLEFLREMAGRHQVWLFGGTCPVSVRPDGSHIEERVRAASFVINPRGEIAGRYDKIHMFDVDVADNQGAYRESDTFEPGDTVQWLDLPWGRVGLSVCYDLRFPELYRQLFENRVDLVAVPSAFTEVTGEAHFELLVRARAVENTCFMVAACQGGVHDSHRRTHGHSMIVSPWGEVLGELGKGEGVLTTVLDYGDLERIRREMPFRSQRKLL